MNSTLGVLLVIAAFYLIVWGGLIYALQKTKARRVTQRKSKYSPFSRKLSYSVSMVHLAADRLEWLKIQVKHTNSAQKYHAERRLESAEEKLKLARANLDNDELLASDQECEAALLLLDEAEKLIA